MNESAAGPFEYYARSGGTSEPEERGDAVEGLRETWEGACRMVRGRPSTRTNGAETLRIRVLFWRAQARQALEGGPAENEAPEVGAA
ncbi:MAG: hypothetical protein ACJ78Q_09400 [Chloroflexia bacterium]